NHDLDDAIRSGVIKSGQIPETCIQYIGSTHSQRALTMIKDLIASSKTLDGNLVLQMSEPVETAMTTLRQFLYDNVYRAPRVHKEFVKAKKILSELFSYFVENQDQLKEELNKMGLAESLRQTKARVVCDLISSMTDRYALSLYSKIFLPTPLF
ncbi:MAG: deoxyguanosinetriphosphate triphosphohydrolase, partial [Proteobacteria bacterium]|nr:deoxyguanosinetriphosphate triphosphohydrolase [Pseudomonadota bacterium]